MMMKPLVSSKDRTSRKYKVEQLIELLIYLMPVLLVLAVGAFIADYVLPLIFGDENE